ncbi:MAG: FG-GAP-like repeat-containing protein, partial [Planctomycetota bacterium]
LLLSGGTDIILADGASLASQSGGSVDLGGLLTLPGGAAIDINGQTVTLSGTISAGTMSQLMTPQPLDVVGRPDLSGFSIIAQSNCGDTGTCEVWPVVAADLDADGDLDVASGAFFTGTISWHENTGSSPAFVTRQVTALAGGVRDLAAADIDGDGDIDLVSSNQNNNNVAWYENDGLLPPGFTRHVVPTAVPNAGGLAVADIDADGDEDLIVSAESANQLIWFESDGDQPPAFTSTVLSNSADEVTTVRAVDLNADGAIDLLTCSQSRGEIDWYQSDGTLDPTFTQRVVADALQFTGSIVADDLDADGDVDIVATDQLNSVFWFDSNGQTVPTFVPRLVSDLPLGPASVGLADMDGDGDTDVVSGSLFDASLWWFESDGQLPPAFTTRLISSLAGGIFDLEVADIDADGAPDIVTSRFGEDAVAWHRNVTPTFNLTELGALVESGSSMALINRTISTGPGTDLSSPSSMTVDRTSRLTGAGFATAATLESAGSIEPAPASTLTINADYTQQYDDGVRGPLTGEIRIPLGDGSAPGTLAVTGSSTLSGSLIVTADDMFNPSAGSMIEIMSSAVITGRFDVAFLPALPDKRLSVVYPTTGSRSGSISLLVTELDGDVTFDPAQATGTAVGVPTDVILADMNDDGFIDLVMTVPNDTSPNQDPGSVFIFYNDGNDGDGTWQGFSRENVSVVQQLFTGIGIQPDAVEAADVDDDGIIDLVIANRGIPGNVADDTLTVLINDPGASGTVTGVTNPFGIEQSRLLDVGDEPRDVTVIDLDADLLPDFAVANAGSDTVTILWNRMQVWSNNEDPEKDDFDLPSDACPFTIRPGEFDADLFHLAVGNTGLGSVSFIRNSGARNLAVLPEVAVDTEPVQLIVSDIDDDGFPEVLTVNRAANTVSVLINEGFFQGGIDFAPTINLPVDDTPSFPRSIAAGDFDSDDDHDLAIIAKADALTSTSERIVKIFRNDTDGGPIVFAPATDLELGDDPLFALAGDVNADGSDDLITVNETLPTNARAGIVRMDDPSISSSLTPEACPADMDGDGRVGLADFATFGRNFGAMGLPFGNGESRSIGDLNDDGSIDLADFSILARNFGCQTAPSSPQQ